MPALAEFRPVEAAMLLQAAAAVRRAPRAEASAVGALALRDPAASVSARWALAAVHASAWCRAMRDDRSLLSCLFEGTPTLRAAALRTTMGWGMREAWRWCVAQGEHTTDAATLPWLAWLARLALRFGAYEHPWRPAF